MYEVTEVTLTFDYPPPTCFFHCNLRLGSFINHMDIKEGDIFAAKSYFLAPTYFTNFVSVVNRFLAIDFPLKDLTYVVLFLFNCVVLSGVRV